MLRRGLDQSGLAEHLGVHVNSAHRYLYGDRLPPLEMIVKIEKSMGIKCALWAEPASKDWLPPGAVRAAS